MSVAMDEENQRWTAPLLEIIQVLTTAAEASRQHDLTPFMVVLAEGTTSGRAVGAR
jgi:hypothetical protein